MAMVRKIHYYIVIITASVLMLSGTSRSVEFDVFGFVESKRKGNVITLLFREKPESGTYYMLHDSAVIGTVTVYSVERARSVINTGYGIFRYRGLGEYSLSNRMYGSMVKVGSPIGLIRKEGVFEQDYSGPVYRETPRYKKVIVSRKDRREMVLVPEGKFILGSGNGRRDESPEQRQYVASFYIDRYEVSNSDYLSFMQAARKGPPRSWEGGSFRPGAGDLPVLVTFHEAQAYARWAGKRLPTEMEWEKAARGPGAAERNRTTIIYPWGNRFDPENANCREFWSSEDTGSAIKAEYESNTMSLLPVRSFSETGASPYNAANMSGNAREWTSSWYMPYKGNTYRNRMYGRQYKVVRGGSWFSGRDRLRATSREIGGIPNLYSDNTAGFRCVRDVMSVDRETGIE